MSPNQILTRAKGRIRTNTANLPWNDFFEMAIDDIFRKNVWRFSRQELNYIHPQQTFEYIFNHDSTELSLNKLVSAYYARDHTLDGGGVPIPVSGTVFPLDYCPYAIFNSYNPDHTLDGYPDNIVLIRDNDGTNGMQIGIFRRPVQDIPIWIYGDFIPSYTIDSNPLPILPKQFHNMVLDRVIYYAAEENGQEKLSLKAKARFDEAMIDLDNWDRRNPIYRPRFQPYTEGTFLKRPRWPDNYPG